MADLLECLLQIGALRTTPARLADAAGRLAPNAWHRADGAGVTPAARLAALARRAVEDAAWLRSAVGRESPPRASGPASDPALLDPSAAVNRFCALRADALQLLESCTAEDLARRAPAGSRSMTVADRVADMLAEDIEAVGRVRLAASSSEQRDHASHEGER